jgi:hypothetical protein
MVDTQEMSLLEEQKYLSYSPDSVVGIATGYGLDDEEVGVRVSVEARIFTSPCRPNRLWGPPNLLSNMYWGLFPLALSGRGVKLTTHLQLVPRSKYVDLYIHSSIRLHGTLSHSLMGPSPS